MDYHKEMYKRHEWEKDRAKSKVQCSMDVAFKVSLLSLLIYIFCHTHFNLIVECSYIGVSASKEVRLHERLTC